MTALKSGIQRTRPSGELFQLRDRITIDQLLIILVVATFTVVASSAIAWDGSVPAWEAAILRWFNSWPDQLEAPLWVLQQAGVFIAPVIGGVVIVWFTRRWYHLIPFVLVLPLKLGIEKAIVKRLVDRERPYVSVGTDIEVRGPAFAGLSFPSGHCTTAFALATLIAAFVPTRWRSIPYGFATVVAVTRLYYGEHNVLDVVVGAALGVAFASILWFTFLNRWVEPPPSTAVGP